MKFTIAIEQGAASWGVVVPDLPGCISAGDTPEDAMENVQEAISVWAEDAARDGEAMPVAKPLSHWQAQSEYQGRRWAMVDVPVREEKARYDEWMRQKVAASLADPRPLLTQAQVEEGFRAHMEQRRKSRLSGLL